MARSRGRISAATRAKVFARDLPQCAECGWKPGDPTRRPKSRAASKGLPTWFLELDHIVPVAMGGKGVPENLQILCSGCNASKGVRQRATPRSERDW